MTKINAIQTPDGDKPLRVVQLTDRQVGIALAAIRHAQDDMPQIEWEEWIESFPNPQDDELQQLCELLNSSVYVAIENGLTVQQLYKNREQK